MGKFIELNLFTTKHYNVDKDHLIVYLMDNFEVFQL